jgi:hypothetical protein
VRCLYDLLKRKTYEFVQIATSTFWFFLSFETQLPHFNDMYASLTIAKEKKLRWYPRKPRRKSVVVSGILRYLIFCSLASGTRQQYAMMSGI